jgi:hypothetical protein
MVAVYGKLSDTHMEGIVNDFNARPHTAALLKDQIHNSSDAFYENKGGDQDIMRIDEEESEGDTSLKKNGPQKDMEKKMQDMERKLKKIQKENDKLKKNSGEARSSCCVIF